MWQCRLLCAVWLVAANAWAFEQKDSYTVALVDKFYPGDSAYVNADERELAQALYGMIDLDGDQNKEPLYHGDIVRLLVSHPRIRVIPYPLSSDELPLQGLLRNLSQLRKDIFLGESIDVVLLPWESSTLISAFGGILETEKVIEYQEKVREWGTNDEVWRLTWEIILVLEDIVEYGGEVFTIAGNGGPRMVNTYSFAEGVTTVGTQDAALEHFIAENAFVDEWAQAAYLPVRLDDSSGVPRGYDLNQDGCVDLDLSKLEIAASRDLPGKHWKLLKGSSFAAPAAVKSSLIGNASEDLCAGE